MLNLEYQPKTKLDRIKLQCLHKILKQIKSNEYRLPDQQELIDSLMYFSPDLPTNEDFAQMGAYVKEMLMVLPAWAKHSKLDVAVLVDGAIKAIEENGISKGE